MPETMPPDLPALPERPWRIQPALAGMGVWLVTGADGRWVASCPSEAVARRIMRAVNEDA